jgi:hypothetical protein
MIAAASAADSRVICGCAKLVYDDIIGGGRGSDSDPDGLPAVGAERTPGVTTGSPFPRLRSVVQPNAAMAAQSETATSDRKPDRSFKCFIFSRLLIVISLSYSTWLRLLL